MQKINDAIDDGSSGNDDDAVIVMRCCCWWYTITGNNGVAMEMDSPIPVSRSPVSPYPQDVQAFAGCTGGDFPYPIIADPGRDLAVQFGMVDPDEKTKEGLPLTCRAVSSIHVTRQYSVQNNTGASQKWKW